MKDKYIFYSVCSLAVLALCVIGIGYATDALPRYKTTDSTNAQLTTDTTQGLTQTPATEEKNEPDRVMASPKKKNCACCSERMTALKARMQKIRNQRIAKNTAPRENQ